MGSYDDEDYQLQAKKPRRSSQFSTFMKSYESTTSEDLQIKKDNYTLLQNNLKESVDVQKVLAEN